MKYVELLPIFMGIAGIYELVYLITLSDVFALSAVLVVTPYFLYRWGKDNFQKKNRLPQDLSK